MLTALMLSVLSADSRLPPECAPPPLHDVAPLKDLASLDGAFSAGLDAVATWCFDSSGNWTAGKPPVKGKRTPADDAPAGDCAKAVVSCESTEQVVRNKEPLRELAHDARADLDRPFHGAKYTPKRSGLREAPAEKADCRGKSRAELFQMAQHRMDLARLTSQIQNEYANYKTWLFSKGLECRNQVLANKKDPTKRSFSSDEGTAESADAGSGGTDVAMVTPAPFTKGAVSSTPEVKDALAGDWLPKWKLLTKLQTADEADRDYTLGFLSSREWKGCGCEKVNPSALARTIEKKEGGDVGLSLLREEDAANTRCELCLLDQFPVWRARATKDCDGMDALNDADFDKLRKSDQANGVPPRCFDESSQRRTEKLLAAQAAKAEADKKKIEELNNAALAAMAAKNDGGMATVTPIATTSADGGALAAAVTPTSLDAGSAATAGGLQTIGGYTYYHAGSGTPAATASSGAGGGSATVAAAGGPRAGTGGSSGAMASNPNSGSPAQPMTAPVGPTPPPFSTTIGGSNSSGRGTLANGTPPRGAADSFAPPEQWAPVPQREDGRLYVRLFMSAACVANIEPGPLEARTGDLMLLPWEAHFVQVKSPCGGLAEVYFGREPKPRVSEIFGKDKPIRFEFKPQ